MTFGFDIQRVEPHALTLQISTSNVRDLLLSSEKNLGTMQYLEGGRVNLRSQAAWFLYCILLYTVVTRPFKIKVSCSKVTA